jgi:hypothetical protein
MFVFHRNTNMIQSLVLTGFEKIQSRAAWAVVEATRLVKD